MLLDRDDENNDDGDDVDQEKLSYDDIFGNKLIANRSKLIATNIESKLSDNKSNNRRKSDITKMNPSIDLGANESSSRTFNYKNRGFNNTNNINSKLACKYMIFWFVLILIL